MAMSNEIHREIPPGFGRRLKEERKRLKLSQTGIAKIAGIGRLAQSNYERELSSPNVDYLSAIWDAGVDIRYLLFGIRPEIDQLHPLQHARIELRAFEVIESIADRQCDDRLCAETRRHLFYVIRNILVQVELGKLPDNFDLLNFLVPPHFIPK
jgi:transcriptional regulator with XRE-family HTH domain